MKLRNVPLMMFLILPVLLFGQVDYYSDIQPIFNSNCINCHISGHSSGLDLTESASYSDLVNVESSGYAPALRVEPYSSGNSVIWNKVANTGVHGGVMPPSGQISQTYIDLIAAWITEGALETPDTGGGDIILSIDSVEVDAYTTDVVAPVNLENTLDDVGGLQFDVIQSPDMLPISDVVAVGRAVGFDVSFNDFGDGHIRVVLVSTAGANIEAGDGEIIELHYDASDVASAVVTLALSGLIVSDPDGNELDASVGEPATVTVGTTASLYVDGGTADAGEQVGISVSLTNSTGVGGLQFDLVDAPNDLTIDSVSVTGRAVEFEVEWTEIGGAIRVVVWDPNNGSIVEGDGEIISIIASIGNFVHAGDISLTFEDVVVSDDFGGSIWIAELGEGVVTVYPGYLEPPVDLTAETGLDGHVPLAWSEPVGGGGENELVEGFEGQDYPEGWMMVDNDGGYNSQFGINTNWMFYESVPHGGVQSIGSIYNDGAVPNDDWLITPMVESSSTSQFIFWASPQDPNYSEEIFDVRVSTQSQEIATFGESLLHHEFPAGVGGTEGDWLEFVVDLSSYVGQEIYVAIQCTSIDQFVLKIDDVKVTNIFSRGEIALSTRLRETPYRLKGDRRGDIGSAIPMLGMYNGSTERSFALERGLEAYNIYRSTTSGSDYELLDVVDASTLNYDDTSVENGTWYYYVVSADYGEMGESNYSNEAEALPAEWVSMSLSNGVAISGYVDTIYVSLENASPVGEFSFTIVDVPNAVVAEDVVTTDRTAGFTVEFEELAGGSMTASFSGGEVASGEGPVAAIAYRASSTSEVVANLMFTQADAAGPEGNIFIVATEGGSFEVFIETQYAMMGGGFADPGGEGTVELSLNNTQPIYGFEIFIVDNPDVLEGISVLATDRVPASIVLSGSETDGVYWITAVGFSDEAIEPGIGPIAEIIFSVDPSAEVETVVNMDFGSYQFWGPGQSEIYTLVSAGDFAIGTPEALFSFGGGSANVGEEGTYTVDLANTVDVYGFQVFIEDFPNWLTVTDVTMTDRIPADASLSWNEFTDGSLRILEFDMTPPVEAITPGEGPILTVTVNVSAGAEEGAVGLSFTEAAASDAEGEPTIFTFGVGDWFGIGESGIKSSSNGYIPDKYTLHQNYPNPFNPTTTIAYDLPKSGHTRISILNLLGQEVTILIDGYLEAGQYHNIWNGRDSAGLPVNSGVYFYRVESKDFAATKKMILLK